MESSFLFSSPSSLNFLEYSKNLRIIIKPSRTRVFASAARRDHAHDHNHGEYYGKLVDVNMIVLRKRIHEMKMVERNYEPPSDWMEWEKRYFTSYDSLICEMMGVLQSQLMNTRPILALGIMALIALSVPLSSAVVFSHFVEMTKMVFHGINQLS